MYTWLFLLYILIYSSHVIFHFFHLNKLDAIQLLLQLCIDGLPSLVEPDDAVWSGLNHSINIQKELFQPGSLSTTGWAAHIHSYGMLKYKLSFNNNHLGSI